MQNAIRLKVMIEANDNESVGNFRDLCQGKSTTFQSAATRQHA